MSNLKTIINNATSIFGKITEAKMKEQLKALKQIEMVSMQAKIPINDIDILKLFRDKPGKNLIVTDPKEINKRLFDFHNTNKEMVTRANIEELLKFEKRIVTNMKKGFPLGSFLDRVNSNAASAAANIVGAKETIALFTKRKREFIEYNGKEEYESQLQRYQGNVDYWEGLIAAKNDAEPRLKSYAEGDGILRDIAKITTKGFWKFVQIKGVKLYFMTTNEVVLFEKNTRQGLNLQKNMGQYCAEVDLGRFGFRILPWKNNIVSAHNIHPYVNQQGGICMGNAGTYFEQARNTYDLAKCMDLLGTIISAYSTAGGPYRPLIDFINSSHPKDMSAMAKAYYKKTGDSALIKRVNDLMSLDEEASKKTANGLSKSIGPRNRRERRNNTPATARNESDMLASLAEALEAEFEDDEVESDWDEELEIEEDDEIVFPEEEDDGDEEGYF